VTEDPFGITTKQVVVAGIVMTIAWIGVGVSIGWWLWGH